MTTRQQLAAAARAAGERYFEDPRGCKHGHQVFYTSSGACVSCAGVNRPMSFSAWANRRSLTGESRTVAKAAWDASRQHLPTTSDRVLACVRGGRDTAAMIAAEVNLTPEHTRRILLALQADGILACDTHGHARIWRLK